MMIIDAHCHVFWHGRDDRALVEDMDAADIDKAWLMTWEIPPVEDAPPYRSAWNPEHFRPDGTHPGIPLSDALRTRDRYPDRFLLGYCPCPIYRHAVEGFEAAVLMHDVRVCGEWKYRVLLDDPRCIELFRAAGELGCPVTIHIDVPYLPDAETGESTYQPNWYGGTVANLERALQACPQTTFIGHAPGFWREISGDADDDPRAYPDGPVAPGGRLAGLFERNPNLMADISANSGMTALRRDSQHAVEFVSRFRDRLLFGRDQYGTECLEFLDTLDLPDDVRRDLLSGNALRLAPLEG